MSFSPIADVYFPRVEQITPGFLLSRGVTFLMLDLDNTISPYGTKAPTAEIVEWIRRMQDARIDLFIVSNNHTARPRIFAEALGLPFIDRANKPFIKGVRAALRAAGKEPSESALAGDQSYTDVLAANAAGVLSILVAPLSLKNPLLAVRYALELPFRAAARLKHRE